MEPAGFNQVSKGVITVKAFWQNIELSKQKSKQIVNKERRSKEMNGRTHNLMGIASVAATTWGATALHSWIVQTLPLPIAQVLTPPAALLFGNAKLNAIANAGAVQNGTLLANGNTNANVGAISLALSDATPGAGAIPGPDSAISFANSVAAVPSLSVTTHLLDALIALFVILLIGIIGGQFADIDQPTSTIANSGRTMGRLAMRYGRVRNPLARLVIKVVAWFVNLLPRTMAYIANHYFGGHRGEVHTLLAVAIVSSLVGLVGGLVWHTPFVGVLFAVAYISHLVVDSFTRSGVNWFAPFNRGQYHLLPRAMQFRSDSEWQNRLVQIVAVLIILVTGVAMVSLLA